jgi:voltage-gated potassium channel
MTELTGSVNSDARAWTGGRLTAFVARHALAWELVTAGLTVLYVVLAFLQDQGSSGLVTIAVVALAGIFAIEFGVRLYDSRSRRAYLRNHWLDIVTCIPVVGPFRALRLVRLVGFVRLGATARGFGVGAAASERFGGGVGLWVLAPILIIAWMAAGYGYYELEGGVNPHINNFADALYFAFVTASTVGYGDVTPVTAAGKVLTGVLIFVGIGLLGFASAQITAKLLPQRNEMAEVKATMEKQVQLLQELNSRLDAVTAILGRQPKADLSRHEPSDEVAQVA